MIKRSLIVCGLLAVHANAWLPSLMQMAHTTTYQEIEENVPQLGDQAEQVRLLDDDEEDFKGWDGEPPEGGRGEKHHGEEEGESTEDSMLYGVSINLTVFTLALIPLYALACAIKDIRCPKKLKSKNKITKN